MIHKSLTMLVLMIGLGKKGKNAVLDQGNTRRRHALAAAGKRKSREG